MSPETVNQAESGLWRDSPDLAGLAEALRYRQRQTENKHRVIETELQLQEHTEQANRLLGRLPEGKPATVGYRIIVLTGLFFFLAVFGTGLRLDYLIFRALHPAGTIWLPLGLACLAIIGITTGTAIAFGSYRHQLVPATSSRAVRNTVAASGAVFAVLIAVYLAIIAPYRSYATGENSIRQAQRVLAADQTSVPRAPRLVLTADMQAIAAAKANLAEAQVVDRLSVGVLALLEIPLAEAAILASELLAADVAEQRRKNAGRRHRLAAEEMERDDRRFDAELMSLLVDHGHGEDIIEDIARRVRRVQSSETRMLSAPDVSQPGSIVVTPSDGGGIADVMHDAEAGEGLSPVDGDGDASLDGHSREYSKHEIRERVATGSGTISSSTRRYLVGKHPGIVKPGKIFSLLVSVTRAGGVPLKNFEVPPGGRQVALVIDAPGLRVLDGHRRMVVVPPSGDSEPAKFDLIGDDPGPRRISVTAFDGGTYIGELAADVSVDPDGPRGPERETRETRKEVGADRTDGEVTLFVRYDRYHKAYRFQFIDVDYPDEVTGPLVYEPGPAVERLLKRLNALTEGTAGYSPEATRAYLTAEGMQLWQELMPEKVRALFWERQSRITQLTILTSHDVVPWELLYPKDGKRDAGFLVEQFPLTRAIFGRRQNPRLRLQPARFILPPNSPSSARTEAETLAALLGVELATVSELMPLLDLIEEGQLGLLHFSGHNRFNSREGSSIMLDTPFTPTFLTTAASDRTLAHTAPVVFINSCGSLSEAPSYNELDGWARKFMDAGAAACIGSLWNVSDSAAMDFAQEFYGRLIKGDPLGKAVMTARRSVAADLSDPTWLAYSVYGNPQAKIDLSVDRNGG